MNRFRCGAAFVGAVALLASASEAIAQPQKRVTANVTQAQRAKEEAVLLDGLKRDPQMGAWWTALESVLPTETQRLIAAVTAQGIKGVPAAETGRELVLGLHELTAQGLGYLTTSPDDILQAYAREAAQYFHSLKAESPALCTSVAAEGRGISPSPEDRKRVFAAAARANVIGLRYAAAGRKKPPVTREAPTEADSQALAAAATALGASEQDLGDMANLASVPTERLCSTAILLADAMAAMEPSALGRIMASNNRKGATAS